MLLLLLVECRPRLVDVFKALSEGHVRYPKRLLVSERSSTSTRWRRCWLPYRALERTRDRPPCVAVALGRVVDLQDCEVESSKRRLEQPISRGPAARVRPRPRRLSARL